MRFVEPLTSEEKSHLEHLWKEGRTPRICRRAHAILLSAKGYKVDALADIFEVDRDTISTWLDRWEEGSGSSDAAKERLEDAPRSGRPRKIKTEHERELFEQVRLNPRQLKSAMAALKERFAVSLDTIKRLLRERGWRWRRLRRSLKEKRDERGFRAAWVELEELKAQEDAGLLDLVYFDAAGFALEPACSSCWQPPGEATTGVLASKMPRVNVLGFMQRDVRRFTPYIIEGTVCSQTVIACINAFAKRLRRETVLVLDNAPVHTSAAFEQARERWLKMGLRVMHLPSYSPELNLIERLWQEIKYRWLPFWAYENRKSFSEALEEILVGIGEKYQITFA